MMETIMNNNINKYRGGDLNHLDYSVNEYLMLTGELTMNELYTELLKRGVNEALSSNRINNIEVGREVNSI
jgi:hypothetical protein